MKTAIRLFSVALMSLAAAHAATIIVLDNPLQTGVPGDLFTFTATISNTGDTEVSLNANSLNFSGDGFSITDLFFENVPVSIAPNDSVSGIPLFTIALNNPFEYPLGPYTGTYTLIGGADGNAQDVLSETSFTVTAVPEPGTLTLSCIVLLAGWRRVRRLNSTPQTQVIP